VQTAITDQAVSQDLPAGVRVAPGREIDTGQPQSA
jgi:hypothetical protein